MYIASNAEKFLVCFYKRNAQTTRIGSAQNFNSYAKSDTYFPRFKIWFHRSKKSSYWMTLRRTRKTFNDLVDHGGSYIQGGHPQSFPTVFLVFMYHYFISITYQYITKMSNLPGQVLRQNRHGFTKTFSPVNEEKLQENSDNICMTLSKLKTKTK